MLHRGVVHRREHEANAGLANATRDRVGQEVDLDAERGERVGRAGPGRQGAVAVLGDGHAGAGDDERGGGGDVVAAGGVTAGADHVHRAFRRLNPRHLGAHGGDGAGDLVHGLAAKAKAGQERAELHRRRLAGHDRVERAPCLVLRQALAGGDLTDDAFQVRHETPRPSSPIGRGL